MAIFVFVFAILTSEIKITGCIIIYIRSAKNGYDCVRYYDDDS